MLALAELLPALGSVSFSAVFVAVFVRAPVVVTVASENMDTGIPAAPGHYSSQTLFGSAAPPGANFEIQVVLIPGR